MSQPKKSANPKVTIIASKGANQAINYLLEDRDELDWLVAIGPNHKGDIFFYDTGGDVIQDLGALEYIKERILRDYFGETDDRCAALASPSFRFTVAKRPLGYFREWSNWGAKLFASSSKTTVLKKSSDESP